MARVLIRLCRQLNALTPVGKLPPELLNRVFMFCVYPPENRTVHNLLTTTHRLTPTASLLCITGVCSQWRSVALNTPVLWTHIDVQNPTQLEAFISRSQSMPLSLVVRSMRLRSVLERYGSRLRGLDVTLTGDFRLLSGLFNLEIDLPRLECLTVRAWSEYGPQVDGPEAIPATLFGQPISRVTALALREDISWCPRTSFPILTHLYLDWNGGQSWLSEDPINYLGSLLRHTPALQHLHLVNLEEMFDETRPSFAIPLPCMRSVVCCSSDMGSALYLLLLLQLPETVFVRLHDTTSIADFPEANFPPRTASPLFLASFNDAQLIASRHQLFLVAEGPHSGFWLHRPAAYMVSDRSGWGSYLSGIEHLGLLPSIQTLRLNAKDDADAVLQLLRCIHSLVELTVVIEDGSQEDVHYNARAIYAALKDPTCCPQLRSLVVLASTHDPENLCPSLLLNMLEARARQGRALRRLAIQQWLPLESSQDPDTVRIERERWNQAYVSISVPAKMHVQVVEVASGEDLRPFTMRDVWEVEGAEDYWKIEPAHRPKYPGPL